MAIHRCNSWLIALACHAAVGSISARPLEAIHPARASASAVSARSVHSPVASGTFAPANAQQHAAGAVKPYKDVVTPQATSTVGLFTAHRIGSRLYYEIPVRELDREFFWVSTIGRMPRSLGDGGGPPINVPRVVRWTRNGEHVLLRIVSHELSAPVQAPTSLAVQTANYEPIVMAFPVETVGPQGALVIDVTRLFTTDVTELTIRPDTRAKAGVQSFDPARAFIERVAVFPENLEVEATHTYAAGTSPEANRSRSSASVLMHYSMMRLPDRPMTRRLSDPRVGLYRADQLDFGSDAGPSKRSYVRRWRLEKKQPTSAVSDPVTPIVYWIDPATPAKWRPYVRQGVEQWQAAFAAAGFSNAILVKQAPTPAEDPTWSADDARHSVIRWVIGDCDSGWAWTDVDPRSGEILRGQVSVCHALAEKWGRRYFVQVAPLDARARTFPLPDGVLGPLFTYIVAHEVGHTLGMDHNLLASSMYPIEKLRDRTWIKKMGHTPSVMDYARFNYVAQVEDGIDPTDLVPRVGPYDIWAIRWGYGPIAEAQTPDEERPTLNQWIREQDETPWFRFTPQGSRAYDPRLLTEAIGDADPIAAATLGLRNLKRVVDLLVPATTAHAGDSYEELSQCYRAMLVQWSQELRYVAALVGGVTAHEKHVGQPGARQAQVPRTRQADAVAFLHAHAFTTPSFLMPPAILQHLDMVGLLEYIGARQQFLLEMLLDPSRMMRLIEQEAFTADQAYRPTAFLDDLRHGLWQELSAQNVRIDTFRRRLQLVYVAILCERSVARPLAPIAFGALVNDEIPKSTTSLEESALFKGELRALDRAVRAARPRVGDRATAVHLDEVRDRIARALHAETEPLPPATSRPQPTEPTPNSLRQFDDR